VRRLQKKRKQTPGFSRRTANKHTPLTREQ
jgi:hypothetical protein